MKQLKQSPVAKIIAWILITVSALMLLAGTAGAYAISELGFYTRSVEDIREKQFERIAGKYSARVLLNLNNTENETYFKDTNFRYGVVVQLRGIGKTGSESAEHLCAVEF